MKPNGRKLLRTTIGLADEQSVQGEFSALGITKFETLSDTYRRQNSMLRRFEYHQCEVAEVHNLRFCSYGRCAVETCREACWIGTRARRIDNISTGIALLKAHDGPLYNVCIVHPLWEAKPGALRSIGVHAARQWTYRRLRQLSPDVIALGIFETSLNVEIDGAEVWAGEIQMIVAGAGRADIKSAFRINKRYRLLRPAQQIVRTTEIKDLGTQFSYCTKRMVQQRIAYISEMTGRQDRNHMPLKAAAQLEHDRWLLGLPLGARTVAFGCGRRGNKFYAR